MPRSSETASLLGDYHRIGGVTTPRSAYGSSDSATTPRSPFETGFPMMFTSPAPSPRPHRLSFAHTKDDSSRDATVFLALLASVVGVGLLAIPYTFLLVPTWLGVLSILLVGLAMAFSATALLNTHVALSQPQEETMYVGAGKRFTSFQSIAVLAGGNIFGYVVSGVTAAGIYGGCVGAIRIVRDIAPFVVAKLYALVVSRHSESPALSHTMSLAWGDYLLCATFAVVVFPLCLVKNLSGLRMSSFVGFAVTLYIVAAIVYRSFEAPALANSTGTAATDPTRTAASTDSGAHASALARFAHVIALATYAFTMHLNLLPLFIQLRGSFAAPLHKSRRKMSDVIITVAVVCAALYVLLGLSARKLFGATTHGNVLLNLEHDSAMAIPLLAVFVTALAGFPLLFQPLRSVLEELVYGSSNSAELPFATRLGGTSCLLLSQLLLALLAPGIEVVFALTGATSGVLICFVFPAVMYTQLFPWHTARGGKSCVIALWGLAVVFTVIGAIATWTLLAGLRR